MVVDLSGIDLDYLISGKAKVLPPAPLWIKIIGNLLP
jgi:hypothetical protein